MSDKLFSLSDLLEQVKQLSIKIRSQEKQLKDLQDQIDRLEQSHDR